MREGDGEGGFAHTREAVQGQGAVFVEEVRFQFVKEGGTANEGVGGKRRGEERGGREGRRGEKGGRRGCGVMRPLSEQVGEGFEGFGLGVVEGTAGDAEQFDQIVGTASVEVTFGEKQVGTPAFFEGVGFAVRFEGIQGALEGLSQGEAASSGGGLVALFLSVRFDERNLGKGQFSEAAGIVPGFEGLVDGGADEGGNFHERECDG